MSKPELRARFLGIKYTPCFHLPVQSVDRAPWAVRPKMATLPAARGKGAWVEAQSVAPAEPRKEPLAFPSNHFLLKMGVVF